jgi:hypothetical protein
MSRELAITIAVVSSLMAVASSAAAGQTICDRNYWPSEVAAHRSQPKAAAAGPLSSFAFDLSGPQPYAIATFAMKVFKLSTEINIVIHDILLLTEPEGVEDVERTLPKI